MFDFLFQNKKGEMESILDIITADVQKIALNEFAREKAAGMIAKAIAKSEFIVQRDKKRTKDEIYWRLNVRPNDNETATDFWYTAIKKLLVDQECVIVVVNGKFYMADSYDASQSVLLPQIYKDITISCNGSSLAMGKMFTANDVIHLRMRNEKLKKYAEQIARSYSDLYSAMCEMKRIANAPKFKLKFDTSAPLLTRVDENGNKTSVTREKYREEIQKLLEDKKLSVIINSAGIDLEHMKIDAPVSSADEITKIAKEAYSECAMAYDIPQAVFMGSITEKADSTNEFITYAVGPVVEIINDSLNAKIVGENDYLKKGERIWLDLSRYKHVDVIESAGNLDKLRAIGFTLDEIREMVGWEPLGTEFSRQRVITKNYTDDLAEKPDPVTQLIETSVRNYIAGVISQKGG